VNKVSAYARNYGIVWAALLLFVLLAVTTPAFLTVDNLRNIMDQQAVTLIVAVFATIVLISGGFDVSLSAVYILAPLVALRMMETTDSGWVLMLVGTAVGVLCGLLNGVVVSKGRINAFIATLATSLIIFGLAYLVSGGSILRITNVDMRAIATTKILGITSATWIAVICVLVAMILLERTRFGRYVFAVGGNREAARLAGVPVDRVVIWAFTLAGLSAGLAGSLNAARTLTAQASDDFGLVFTVIAAVVVGGTSIAGGSGAIWRTVVGVFFIALLGNGFNLNGIDPIVQRIVQGLVILAAVGADAWSRSQRE
jgi:ribose transport system permease protein